MGGRGDCSVCCVLSRKAIRMIAGVDGCKGGWLAAVDRGNDKISLESFTSFKELARETELELVVIDIPIGLTDCGPRLADREARKMLKQRGCCVFSAPLRPLLACKSYADASRLRYQIESKRCSCQSFGIFSKIKCVDDCLLADANLRALVKEGHPEVTFAIMNGGEGLSISKHKDEGREARLRLLEKWFKNSRSHVISLRKSIHEDAIDAYAMLWTARRVASRSAEIRRFPDGEAPLDSAGLAMQIIA